VPSTARAEGAPHSRAIVTIGARLTRARRPRAAVRLLDMFYVPPAPRII
jgi:hypothetical protein